MKQTLRDSCTLFPLRYTPEKHTVSPPLRLFLTHWRGARVTEESSIWRSSMCLPFTRNCNPLRCNLSCNLTEVCFDCLLRLNEKKRISLLLHENTAKISMTFLKSCFSDTEIEIRWLAGETKAFLPFWTSHSLRLGAQALHKMSIDKFSSPYVTHAQFESYWWGRKKRRLFRLGSALLMNFCDRAANVQHGATAAALDGERARRCHYATPWRWCLKCLLLLPIHPSTLQPPHCMNIRIHKPQRSCQSILVLPAFDFSQSKSFWQRFPASKKIKK